MGQVKKPKLEQKKVMTAAGLRWEAWNVEEDDGETLTLVSKRTKRRRKICRKEKN